MSYLCVARSLRASTFFIAAPTNGVKLDWYGQSSLASTATKRVKAFAEIFRLHLAKIARTEKERL